MWDHIWVIVLFVVGWFAFTSAVADKVEEKLKDRLDEIEDKLDTIECALSPRKDPFKGID